MASSMARNAGHAGLRIAEVCALRVEDIDFTRGVVHPKRQWPDLPLKTAGSDQPIPIPRELTLLLAASVKAYPGEYMISEPVAGSRCGPWTIERAIRAARSDVDGLPEGFTFHDLRHYLASLLIALGADIKTVQALRHATASTTLDVSGHLMPDADQSTRTAIAKVITERLETAADPPRTDEP
jgi:integrase